jgi:hypothetical protein
MRFARDSRPPADPIAAPCFDEASFNAGATGTDDAAPTAIGNDRFAVTQQRAMLNLK